MHRIEIKAKQLWWQPLWLCAHSSCSGLQRRLGGLQQREVPHGGAAVGAVPRGLKVGKVVQNLTEGRAEGGRVSGLRGGDKHGWMQNAAAGQWHASSYLWLHTRQASSNHAV